MHPQSIKKLKKLKKTIAFLKYKEYNIKRGDDDDEDTPVPIPNTEVKLVNAENTCGLPYWKDR